MRILGLFLVAASIALSAGGVAYRHPALAAEPPAEPASGDAEVCPLVQATESAVRRARISVPAAAAAVVSLGTRGFNYSRPGDPVPTEVRSPDAPPAASAD
jgi:hypothetical protein